MALNGRLAIGRPTLGAGAPGMTYVVAAAAAVALGLVVAIPPPEVAAGVALSAIVIVFT